MILDTLPSRNRCRAVAVTLEFEVGLAESLGPEQLIATHHGNG